MSEEEIINKQDRDGIPKKMVDATKMPLEYIAAMTADWLAMSEEKGSNVYDWAEKNINKRWKFTDEQVELVYSILDKIRTPKAEASILLYRKAFDKIKGLFKKSDKQTTIITKDDQGNEQIIMQQEDKPLPLSEVELLTEKEVFDEQTHITLTKEQLTKVFQDWPFDLEHEEPELVGEQCKQRIDQILSDFEFVKILNDKFSELGISQGVSVVDQVFSDESPYNIVRHIDIYVERYSHPLTVVEYAFPPSEQGTGGYVKSVTTYDIFSDFMMKYVPRQSVAGLEEKAYTLEEVQKIQSEENPYSDIIFDAQKGDVFKKIKVPIDEVKGIFSYEFYKDNDEDISLIDKFMDKIDAGEYLNPIVVDEDYKIMDGLHRAAAYKELKINEIEVFQRVLKQNTEKSKDDKSVAGLDKKSYADIYYHGTTVDNAYKIAEQGYIKAPENKGKGFMVPLEGRSYFAKDLGYALIYALGGDYLTEDPKDFPEIKTRDGAIITIDASELEKEKILIDEDIIAQYIESYIANIDSKEVDKNILNELIGIINNYSDLRNRLENYKRKNIMEFAKFISLAKAIIKKLGHNHFLFKQIAEKAKSYSYSSNIPIKEVLIISKENWKYIKPDGSNLEQYSNKINVKQLEQSIAELDKESSEDIEVDGPWRMLMNIVLPNQKYTDTGESILKEDYAWVVYITENDHTNGSYFKDESKAQAFVKEVEEDKHRDSSLDKQSDDLDRYYKKKLKEPDWTKLEDELSDLIYDVWKITELDKDDPKNVKFYKKYKYNELPDKTQIIGIIRSYRKRLQKLKQESKPIESDSVKQSDFSKSIEQIAKEVRDKCIKEYDEVYLHCTEFSKELRDELNRNGYEAKVIKGNFKIDEPKYIEEDDEDVYELEHVWVEINGEIIDISVDQFNDYLDEDMEDIEYPADKSRYDGHIELQSDFSPSFFSQPPTRDFDVTIPDTVKHNSPDTWHAPFMKRPDEMVIDLDDKEDVGSKVRDMLHQMNVKLNDDKVREVIEFVTEAGVEDWSSLAKNVLLYLKSQGLEDKARTKWPTNNDKEPWGFGTSLPTTRDDDLEPHDAESGSPYYTAPLESIRNYTKPIGYGTPGIPNLFSNLKVKSAETDESLYTLQKLLEEGYTTVTWVKSITACNICEGLDGLQWELETFLGETEYDAPIFSHGHVNDKCTLMVSGPELETVEVDYTGII